MNKMVLASNNQGKVREFKEILRGYEIVTPKDLGLCFDVEETGDTFYENALIKAKALFELCGLPTVADDSGLCVDALGGMPGVYSARYSGGSDADNIKKLLGALEGEGNRKAHFTSCVVYYDGKRVIDALGNTYGEISLAPDGDNGFGYDPVFISSDLGKSFGRATDAEKNSVSHRARALKALFDKLNSSAEES